MTTVEALKKAKAAIQKYGWVQFAAGNKQVGFCMTGAVRHVVKCTCGGESSLGNCAITKVDQVLRRTIKYQEIADYNDKPNRTKEQILGRFDKAIQLAKNS